MPIICDQCDTTVSIEGHVHSRAYRCRLGGWCDVIQAGSLADECKRWKLYMAQPVCPSCGTQVGLLGLVSFTFPEEA